MSKFTRRHFVHMSMMGMGSIIVSGGIGLTMSGCSSTTDGLENAAFNHGVASGDPLSDRVILWTRVTPERPDAKVRVFWEVALDEAFQQIVVSDSGLTGPERDYTIKVDAQQLEENMRYWYRFSTVNEQSVIGSTRTLAAEQLVEQVKFAVVSCSNYPAGYFHVYGDIAQRAREDDLDVAIHLGDYLYEYPQDGYASEDAERLGRSAEPRNELFTLADYRRRYQQYRSDIDLQSFHQALPMIAVWDDHEVANDAWREGAENHNEGEGSYVERLMAALQAYAEWMPIRPAVDTDIGSLYRNFRFGNLVNLSMLDTRLVGRDPQLSLDGFFKANGSFDTEAYFASINRPERTLLGTDQLAWLEETLDNDTAEWQVLGQQVLMGKMELPGAVATGQLSIPEFAELATLAGQAQADPSVLTPDQLASLQEKEALLRLPALPYNLDAWDGYPAEREKILEKALASGTNLVVLAGDTHNAWANDLTLDNQSVGVELATASVTSPGLESFLGLDSLEAAKQTESGLVQLIDGLKYSNLSNRGYLMVTFTQNQVDANWIFIDTVKDANYEVLTSRSQHLHIKAGDNQLTHPD